MKISTLMKEYIDRFDERESFRGRHLIPESLYSLQVMPVQPVENHWKVMTDPERLARSYMFNSLRQRSLFLEELLNEELRTGHFAKIIVEGKQVVVEVWTHDLERVTELDKEYATTCDVIYKDVMLMSV